MKDSLGKAIAGVSVALALLTVAGIPVFGSVLGPAETTPLLKLEWVQPTAQSFIVLSAFATAVLCLGRYRALGGAWVYWTGTVFLANAILGVFYLLSWPGLIGDRGVIAQLSNTASWLFLVTFSCLAFLVMAVDASRSVRLRPLRSLGGHTVSFMVAVLIGLVSVTFEPFLPALAVGGVFTPLAFLWEGTLAAVLAIAALRVQRRYRFEQDAMLGYLAIFLALWPLLCSIPLWAGSATTSGGT